MSEQIEYKGFLYTIPFLEHEPFDVFIKRAWFIVKQLPQTNEDFENITNYSILWSNIFFKGCIYNDNLMNKIKKMEEKYLNII